MIGSKIILKECGIGEVRAITPASQSLINEKEIQIIFAGHYIKLKESIFNSLFEIIDSKTFARLDKADKKEQAKEIKEFKNEVKKRSKINARKSSR